ncbi:MAG: TlpA family protein disulfide reductase, partial [Solirubrobacterales bacterium]
DCETSASPCPAQDSRTPACEVEVQGVIRVCDYFDRPLVLSFWFTTPADCPPTQDAVDRVARRYGDRVGFLSIAVRGERSELQQIVRERGWTIDVGWDRDGAASNLYRVGLCPTVAFVLPGGLLNEARVGTEELGDAEITAAIERLVAEARRRGEAAR